MKFKSNIELQAGLEDNNAASGTTGQVLSSTGTGVEWIDQSALTDVQSNFVYFDVKNETGSTINKGKGVMAVGTDGNSGHILIDEMVADGSVEPKYFLGVLETTVANGGFARVISFGQLDQFDTRGQNGETWNDGDILWCDPDSDGDFTITEPDGPNVKIAAAIVLNASTNGKIQVRATYNEGIHDLHDTKIVNQVDGDILVWDNTTGVWFNDSTLNVNQGVGVDITGNLDVSGDVTISKDNPSLIIDDNLGGRSVSIGVVGDTFRIKDVANNSSVFTVDFSQNPPTLIVSGDTTFNQGVDITGTLDVSGTTNFSGNVYIDQGSSLRFYNTAQTSWANFEFNEGTNLVDISRGLNITGNTYLNVGGTGGQRAIFFQKSGVTKSQITSNYNDDNFYIFHNGNKVVLTQTEINLNSSTNITGDLDVSGSIDSFNLSTDQNINVGNDLIVTGNVYASNLLSFSNANINISPNGTGEINLNKNTNITGSLGITGGSAQIDLYDRTSNGDNVRHEFSGGQYRFRMLDDSASTNVVVSTVDLSNYSTTFNYSVVIDPSASGNALAWRESDSSTLAGQLRSYGNRGDIYLFQNGVRTVELVGGGDSYINGGNVGIGTTSPSTKFHVVGAAVDNESLGLFTNNYSGGGVFYPGLKVVNTSSNHSYGTVAEFRTEAVSGTDRPSILFTNAHSNHNWTVGQGGYAATDNFSISYRNFHPNTAGGWGTPRFVIDTAGNVGIGTNSPGDKLQVAGNAIIQDYAYIGDGVQHWGDGGTGMNFPANDTIDLATSSTSRIRINSSGNVGIGTTNPAKTLHISDGTNDTPTTFRIENTDTSIQTAQEVNSIEFYTNDSSASGTGVTTKIAQVAENAGNQYGLAFSTYNLGLSEAMRIDEAGNVGIGTTSPVDKLDVRGTARITSPQANDWIVLAQNYATGAKSGFWDSGGNVHLYLRDISSNTNVLIRPNSTSYFNGGNVGIGTTTPNAKLDVAGNVSISNTATARLDISGGGNGYVNAAVSLRTTDDDTNRGNGIYSYNDARGIEWFFGNPYNTSDTFSINRRTGATGYNESTADPSYSIFTVSSNGNLDVSGSGTFGDDITIPNNTSVIASNSTGSETSQVIGTTGGNGIVIGQSARWNSTNIYSGGVGYTLEMDSSKNSTFNGNLDVSGTGTLSRGVISSYAIQSSQGVDIGIGGDNDAGVIQSFASKPLFLNPVGNQVQIGSGGLNVSGNLTLNNNKELRFKNTANNAVGVMTLYSDNTLRIFNGNSTSGNIEFRDGSAIGTLNASIRGSDGKFLANFGANITGNLDVSGDVTAQGDTVTLLNENSGNKNINIRKRFDGSSYINWIRSSNTDAYIGVDETENLQIGYASSGLNRDLIFTSNNSEVIRFDRQGNVGIGTASPTSPLTIKSDSVSAQDSGITIQANGSTNDIIRMGEKSTNGGRLHMFDGGVEKIAFYTDGTDNHISAGNVGIGTTTVNAKLHVYSSTADLVSRFESSDALSYIQINDNSDSVYVGTQSGRGFIGGFASLNSSNLNINLTTGNVGIGTTSPDSLLEISSSSATDFLKLTSGGGGANPVKLIFEKSSVEQGIIEYNRNGDLEIYNIDSDGGVMIDGSASGGGDLYVNNAGNVGIGTTSPGEKLEVVGDTFINGQIYGGVGAETTSGTTDWNHSTNARSGNGYTLLRGNATNGPAGSEYYHPFSFEYSAKNGTGNLTQFAIPYSTNNTGMYFRSRYNSTWTGWSEIWTSNNDGADSGLDADLLDGQQGSYYAAASSLSSYLPLAGGTMTGTSGVLFPDNFKLNIGTSSDLQIYHNGSISYIDQTGVGKLILNTLNTGINIQAGSGETRFTKSGINSEIKVDDASQANKIVLKASGNSYLNGGNVGIGTTSPSYKLDVNGGAGVPLRLYSSADQQLLLNSPNSWTGIGFNDGAASGTDYIWHNGVNQTFAIGGGGSNVSGKKLHVHGATTIGSGLAGTAVPTDGLLVQGNVGIGTGAPPEGRFEVQTIDSNRYIRFKAPNGEQRFQFYTGGTGNAAAQFMYNSDGTTRNVQISAGGTSYFNAGNVGIGTTNPNHKLDIYADSNVPLRIHRQSSSLDTTEPVGIGFSHRGDNNTSITDTRAGIFSSYNGDLFLSVDAGGRVDDDPIADAALFIEGTNGNVGIGTTSPSEKLDVVGNIELSGNVINASNTAYYLDLDGTSKLNHGSFSSTLGFGAFTAGTRGTLLEGYSTHSVVRTDSARLDFYMGKTTTGVGTMMSLTDTGKVGIGTTNPSEKLDVIGNIELTQHLKATGGNLSFSAGGNQIMNIDLNGKVYPTTDSAYDLGFSSTLAWRNLYIDNVYANNNVGIGTTSPVFKLDVHNSGSGIRHYGDSNNQLETFCYGSYQTLIATNGSVTNEFGYVGGNFYIQTNDEEKFRITSSGNVGVGTTSPSSRLHVAQTLSSSSVPMVYFEADSSTYTTTNVRVDNVEYGAGMSFYRAATYDNKAIAFINGTTQVGSISINTSSTSYNTTSDYRLKENLTEITDGIERVKQLQPKRFNFIGDTDTVDGFIAHEAQEVVPEAVTGEKDGVLPNGDPIYQGIDQAKLVPLLTAALQEAITKIEQLETRIQTLENK